MRALSAFPLLAFTLALAACAGAAGGGGPRPDEDRPLAALVDSAALVDRLKALAPPPQDLRVKPLFRVTWDSAGRVDDVEALYENVPTSHADPVAAAIRAHLKTQPPGRRYGTILRAVSGPAAVLEEPDVDMTPPSLANRGDIGRMLSFEMEAQLSRHPEYAGRRYYAILKFRVLGNGGTDSVRVTRSSGQPDLDRQAVLVVNHMRFRPATIEGHGVRVWVELPVNFAFDQYAEQAPRVGEDPGRRRPRFP